MICHQIPIKKYGNEPESVRTKNCFEVRTETVTGKVRQAAAAFFARKYAR